MTTPMLELTGIDVSFGKLQVLHDVDVSVPQGELLGIVGPNGAGKSTLFNVIAGDVRPSRGRVVYDGRDVTSNNSAARSRSGIGRTYQIPRPFSGMTVFENVLVSVTQADGKRGHTAGQAAVECLELTGLLPLANTRAGELRLLDRKRLEVARALGCSPQLLLFDEIAGGLTDPEVQDLLVIVTELKSRGLTIIWIEHVVHALLAVANRLMCLTYGKVLMTGDPHEVMTSREVREVYLGTAPEEHGSLTGGVVP